MTQKEKKKLMHLLWIIKFINILYYKEHFAGG